MIQRIYLYVVYVGSVLACVIFGTIALATQLQEPVDLKTRKSIVFRVDSSFNQEEQKAIGNALVKWEKATNGMVSLKWYVDDISISELFSWQEDGLPTIYNASSRFGWLRHVSQYITVSNDILGAALSLTGDIFMIDDMPKRFEVVVVHEVGHVLLGSFHSTNRNSVMYPSIGDDYMSKLITPVEIHLLQQRLERENKCFFK